MSKRKAVTFEDEFNEQNKHQKKDSLRKHTLDSDEDDSGDDDRYNVMNENDIEGEEDGTSGMEGETKFTPFNMKEELEEGHFDLEGHFQWDKEKQIRDNWLDNIDWVKVKTNKKYVERTNRGLADSSDSEDAVMSNFDEIEYYKKIFEHMQPGETVKRTLQRLGNKKVKLSSVERWKRKKAGIDDEKPELVEKITEWANEILTQMGNMDIYEETYEMIQRKINQRCKNVKTDTCVGVAGTSGGGNEDELDMYADDFDTKEKNKLNLNKNNDNTESTGENNEVEESQEKEVLLWEYKWKQEDTDVHGSFTTEQMQKWVDEGYFKSGVFIRKVGEGTNFYSSNRIDFELYM